MRTKISFLLKIAVVVFCLLGLILNSVYSTYDGYTHWSKRLLYFTTQSNIWVLLITAILLIYPFTKAGRENRWTQSLYTVKFIFTVSIAITAIVFCCFLGPFADESYHSWSFHSILLHAVVPSLMIADFFVDDTAVDLSGKTFFTIIIPPLCYFILAGVLCAFKYDYGRGEPYPYFFMNFYSPAGFFGFSDTPPFNIGSFYWILFFLLIMLGVGKLFVTIKKKSVSK
ncbi:MAG: hypothetical protein IJV95_02120 [Clostridia bacterium]|nr:hypothetical protein [Clostridia bacterium]